MFMYLVECFLFLFLNFVEFISATWCTKPHYLLKIKHCKVAILVKHHKSYVIPKKLFTYI